MNQIMTQPTKTQTMTSIELIDFINADRQEKALQDPRAKIDPDTGKPKWIELQHKNLYAKVIEVLGEGCAKFLADYKHPQNGQIYPMYVFPKREACLMAMSYSYDLQAKVFDRMTEMEAVVDPLAGLPAEHRALIAVMVENAAIKAEQAAQAAQIAAQADSIKRIEANQQAAVASVQSFTALGYSIYREIPMSKIELIKLGKRASAISKKRGLTIDHVADGRHGRVGSYHFTVLDEALEEMTK